MKYSRLWVLTAIIASAILISFALSVPHTRDINNPVQTSVETVVPSVTLHDSFKKGVHTITGSLTVPNACATVTAQASLVNNGASSTDSIVVDLSLPKDFGICLQVPTRITFTTTISAPIGLPIQATVDGVVATTTAS